MKSKQKLVLILVGIAVLVVVALLGFRWIGRLLIGGVNSLQAAGEAPLPSGEEEVWVAPTPAPEEDFAAQEAQALSNLPDDPEPTPTDEAEADAPVLESPEQLAGTAEQSSIVDVSPGESDAG